MMNRHQPPCGDNLQALTGLDVDDVVPKPCQDLMATFWDLSLTPGQLTQVREQWTEADDQATQTFLKRLEASSSTDETLDAVNAFMNQVVVNKFDNPRVKLQLEHDTEDFLKDLRPQLEQINTFNFYTRSSFYLALGGAFLQLMALGIGKIPINITLYDKRSS
jgi:hypothetical protein